MPLYCIMHHHLLIGETGVDVSCREPRWKPAALCESPDNSGWRVEVYETGWSTEFQVIYRLTLEFNLYRRATCSSDRLY